MTREINGTTTDPVLKDAWETPPEVVRFWAERGYRFTLDVAANANNAKAPEYFTEEQDALKQCWKTTGAVWCNPPYSKIEPWILKASEEAALNDVTTVMLVPASTDAAWYKRALLSCASICLVTRGRIPFINAATGKPVKNNTRGSVFLIWHGRNMGATYSYQHVDRDLLMGWQKCTKN